jgi:hypothetical protein
MLSVILGLFLAAGGAVTGELLDGLADAAALLESAPGGGSPDEPVLLPARVVIPRDWAVLLGAIGAAGKYVALDLSDCVMEGPEFDPALSIGSIGDSGGPDRIVSLILPAAARRIRPGAGEKRAAFRDFTALGTVRGGGITVVGRYAFFGLDALRTAEFPAAEIIGRNAFSYCGVLEAAEFPAAKTVGRFAFSGCAALKAAVFPAAEIIDGSALSGCVALSRTVFPAAWRIGRYAFFNCGSLEAAAFPSAETVEEGAFWSCEALRAAEFPAVKTIGPFAFSNCVSLEAAAFPAVKTVGLSAFGSCTALESAAFPVVETIGGEAFHDAGAASLAVVMPRTAPTVDDTHARDTVLLFFSRTVTVMTPPDRTGYDGIWRNAFIKTFGPDRNGAAVTLRFEELPEGE